MLSSILEADQCAALTSLLYTLTFVGINHCTALVRSHMLDREALILLYNPTEQGLYSSFEDIMPKSHPSSTALPWALGIISLFFS